MPEYKKKNVKKVKLNRASSSVNKRKPVKAQSTVDVAMKPSKQKKTAPVKTTVNKTVTKHRINKEPKPQKQALAPKKHNGVSYKVIIGDKAKNAAKNLRKIIAVVVVIGVLVTLSSLTPTGVFEYMQNTYAALGSGDFPKELTGSQTVNSEYKNNKLFVITDMAYTVYNSGGKTVFSDTHGYSNPFMKVADARTLVLDQNGVGYKIYNLNNTVVDQTLKDDIITGDISRNGTYAIVTKPSDYASKVEVYSKNDKLLFSWSSSQEIVTAVCLSNNGKKLAVATIYSDAGEYISKVYVFNYKNAQPLLNMEYDQPVLYLKTLNSSTFVSVTNTKLDFIKWRNQKVKTVQTEGSIMHFRHISNNEYLVSCQSSMNNLETRCTIYNARFEAIKSVLFSGSAEDVTYQNGNIICFDDNSAYAVNESGTVASSTECGYSVQRIFAKNSKTIFSVSDTEIKKINLE